jgi:hypothetical protein
MNKSIKIIVWFLLTAILISGFIIVKNSFGADSPEILSYQYNRIFAVFLIKKINTIDKNTQVVLYLKDGSKVAGLYKGYSKYDDSIWILKHGDIFQTGYGIYELQDVVVVKGSA